MPKEYIEREALFMDLSETLIFSGRPGEASAEVRGANKVISRIKNAPTADVVEVVRCGECIHHSKAITPGRVICDKHAIPRNDTDFCSDGRRDKPEN